ncbi:T9SS C-terminal target domain-containing protein [Bacteroidia bacterium]|nr:T9SS C-terminal target domain-containing protein [Bacteroidia bacterium]
MQDIEIEGLTYDLSTTDNTATVKRMPTFTDKHYSGDIVVPATVEYGKKTYTVTAVGDNTFSNSVYNRVTSVALPNTITAIGKSAFEGAEIETIEMPNVISIGERAFYACHKLKSITLNNSLTKIEKEAFNATGLTSIVIPNSVTSIGASAFAQCTSLESVTLGNNVETIGNGAFSISWVRSITLPNSVKAIGSYAFSNSQLNTLNLNNGLEIIGEGAFNQCRLTFVDIPKSVTSIGEKAFYGLTSLSSVSVHWETPLDINPNTFNFGYSASLNTLKGTYNLYNTSNGWRLFAEITDILLD